MQNKPPASSPEEHDSYDPTYFSYLFEVEDRHFWFRARNRVISAAVSQVIARLAPGYRLLEVGCGTGNVLRALEQTCKEGTVIGMDLFGEGLQYARRRVSCPLVQGDIHANPFGTRFEVIGLFDVLEHLPNDVEVLQVLRGMLTPGGALIITVPAHMSLWSYFDEASHHCRRYELAELTQKLRAAGYQVEFVSQYMISIFPLVWLGRRLASLRRRKSNNEQQSARRTQELTVNELRIRPIANGILCWLLEQEARLIARRRKLPLGTSLLAIARAPSTPTSNRVI